MAQDWLNTLDYDFGGLHPDVANRLTQLFTSLRTGFSGSTAPADPVDGQFWLDTSMNPPMPKVRRGSAWYELSSGPAQSAPIAGETRSSVWSNGDGSTTLWATLSEDIAIEGTVSTSTFQIPAGARVRAIGYRSLATASGVSNFNIGVSGAATRFGSAVSATSGTTHVGYGDETRYASATSVTVTANTAPLDTDGEIRLQIHYELITAPSA